MNLRPYQVAAIDAARTQFKSGKKRVLIVAPTGAGKTVLFADIVRRATENGSRSLIVAHRRELITQASNKLNAAGVRHGLIQAGFPMQLGQPVQVASIQTLMNRLTALTRVDLIVFDECHHVTTSNSYAKVLAAYESAFVLGVTATPWRLDGRGLADVFDGHVIASTPRQLRDEGFLVPVGGWEYEGIDTSSARISKGDYVQADLQASAKSARVVGDIISEWLMHAGGKRTVLFATSIEQSLLMVHEFQKAGVAAEHVDGEMATEERDAVLRRFRAGETTLVSNCNVLTEGFDAPEIEVVILARPTLSTSLYLQMVGRGLRPSPGKAMTRIHDHAGCLAAHGHPYADRDYSPETSTKGERDAAKKAAKVEKRCKACRSVIARWPCDGCGYSPTPKELQLEYDVEAERRRIEADGAAPKKKTPSTDELRAKWLREYHQDEERKHHFFRRMVDRHGVEKGCRVYRWFSGGTEWPPRQWRDEYTRQEASSA